VRVKSGTGKHFEETGLADMVGAGARHENPARAEHLKRAEIQFLIAPHRGIQVSLAFREGWRIQNDYVVTPIGG